MSTLMILQCTGTKEPGGQAIPVHDPFAAALGPTRNQLIAHFQPNLDFTQLMPAVERYSAGQLYSNIDLDMMQEKINQGSLRVVIVSALFGALEYDTPIPLYNLTMTQVQQSWLMGNLLGNAIQRYVLANSDIMHIKSFVSTASYFPAMGHFTPPGIVNLGNQWIPYSRGAQVAIEYINPFIANL